MKIKLFFLLVLIAPLSAIAQEDSRIGLTLGFGSTDYEYSRVLEESGDIANNDADFSTTYYGFDYGFGNHTFALTVAGSGSETVDQSGTYFDDAYYSNRDHELEFEDFSINYTYRLNSNWRVGIGYNEFTTDTVLDYSEDVPFTGIGYDNDNQYTWNYDHIDESTSDGMTVFAGYVTPLSNNLFFTARLGYTKQDYEATGNWTDVISGLSNEFNSCLSGNGCPDGYSYSGPTSAGINGYGFEGNFKSTGDASAAVFGLGLVWSLNPKNSITFEYSFRSFDYGELNSSSSQTATGYFANYSVDEGPTSNDNSVTNDEIEEDLSFFTVRWRYAIK